MRNSPFRLKTIFFDTLHHVVRFFFNESEGTLRMVCWGLATMAICLGVLCSIAQARTGPPIPICIQGKVLEHPWMVHDLLQMDDHRFQGAGPDPFLVSPELGTPFRDVEGIVLYMQGDPNMVSMPIQVFWKSNVREFREDTSYIFSVEVTGKPKKVWLPFSGILLPDSDMERLLFIRVDWVRLGDTIGFSRMDVLLKGETPPADAVRPVMIRSPIGEIPVQDDFRRYGAYRIHDLVVEGPDSWRVKGMDPHLETADLNVRLKRVKGMYIRFRISGGNRPQLFQVFWKTYSADYDEKRSFWLRAQVKDGQGAFYIPFRVLPVEDMLRSIRIDLENCPNCLFQIVEGRLITREDPEMLYQVPPNIMVALGRSVYGNDILQDIVEKVRRDPGFFAVWGLLVIAVGGIAGHRVWMGCAYSQRRGRHSESTS